MRRRGRRAGADRQAEAGLTDGRIAAGVPRADQVDPVDEEDHPRDGAHRRLAHHQGAGARAGGRAVRPRADPGGVGGGDVLQRRPPAHHRAGGHARGRPSWSSPATAAWPARTRRRVLKEAERLARSCAPRARRSTSTSPGARASPTSRSAGATIAQTGPGSPTADYDNAEEIGNALVEAFVSDEEGGVDEVHVVYTRFRSMLVQEPTRHPAAAAGGRRGRGEPRRTRCCRSTSSSRTPRQVLDALLPRYVKSRIFYCLLQASASRAGGPAAGDEVRDRQRRGPHPAVHPDRQPGPPGRDHPGNQRDRRRCQRPRPRRNRRKRVRRT